MSKTWTWRGRPLSEVPSAKLLWAVASEGTECEGFREACHEELDLRFRAWRRKHPRRRWRAREERREAGDGQ